MFKWIICFFIFSTTSSEVKVIDGVVKYDSLLECNQSRLQDGMTEMVRGLLVLKGVASVSHKCVMIIDKQIQARL